MKKCRVPVRAYIWILLLLSRYISQLIRVNYRYTKYYMVSEGTTSRLRASCKTTEAERSKVPQSRVPWRNMTIFDYGKFTCYTFQVVLILIKVPDFLGQ